MAAELDLRTEDEYATDWNKVEILRFPRSPRLAV